MASTAAERPRAAPGSIAWKIHRERVLLAGWGRAILLQLAHPLVARGVADHSPFARDPRGGLGRLRSTLRAMLALTFGPEEDARAAADRINRIHDRVHGVATVADGPAVAPGTPYSARDPALLAWVHVTLVDSFLVTYELFVGDLSPEERDRYCEESAAQGPRLGIPEGRLPRTAEHLRECLAAELAGGRVAVTDTARALAREILHPRLPWPARPLAPLARLITVGLLPPVLRGAYGLEWTDGRERVLHLAGATSRRVLPGLPATWRHWRAARRAVAREAAISSGAAPRPRPGGGSAPRWS